MIWFLVIGLVIFLIIRFVRTQEGFYEVFDEDGNIVGVGDYQKCNQAAKAHTEFTGKSCRITRKKL